VNGESFNIYQGRIGSSVTELQRLEFYVSRMHNLVICISFLRTKATIVAFVAKGLRLMLYPSCICILPKAIMDLFLITVKFFSAGPILYHKSDNFAIKTILSLVVSTKLKPIKYYICKKTGLFLRISYICKWLVHVATVYKYNSYCTHRY